MKTTILRQLILAWWACQALPRCVQHTDGMIRRGRLGFALFLSTQPFSGEETSAVKYLLNALSIKSDLYLNTSFTLDWEYQLVSVLFCPSWTKLPLRVFYRYSSILPLSSATSARMGVNENVYVRFLVYYTASMAHCVRWAPRDINRALDVSWLPKKSVYTRGFFIITVALEVSCFESHPLRRRAYSEKRT